MGVFGNLPGFKSKSKVNASPTTPIPLPQTSPNQPPLIPKPPSNQPLSTADQEQEQKQELERIQRKKQERTLARVGLTPHESSGAGVNSEKVRTPPKDTRKKGNKHLQAYHLTTGNVSSVKKKEKKEKKSKKTTIDPNEVYALEKEAPTLTPSHETTPPLSIIETDDSNSWYACIRCQEHATLRPLIGESGEYLCHTCYWSLHPQTAKLEASGLTLDHVKEVEEGEECRSCLDQGYLRRCCNEFYCHKCYLASGFCPGCNFEVKSKGMVEAKRVDPGIYPVIASWVITGVCFVIIAIAGIVLSVNENTLPTTIWDNTCHGLFPACDVNVCIDLQGLPSDGIQSLSNYTFCEVNATVNKVRGNVCVYDSELYVNTEHKMGFDFCRTSSRDDADKLFNNGVFVFEDDFDTWVDKNDHTRDSVRMASANWEFMQNGFVSDICGTNQIVNTLPYPLLSPLDPSELGEGALVFSGVLRRRAITKGLDMRHGGYVSFYIKFAPITNDEDETLCKTAFGGDVVLEYSLDDGVTFAVFGEYRVFQYRGERFTYMEEELPEAAWSNNTVFKWEQPTFEAIRDYWSIDDIAIFHRFKETWREDEKHLEYKAVSDVKVQIAQCCFETEMCENDPALFVDAEMDCSVLHGHTGENRYLLRGADAYIAVSALVALSLLCYRFVSLMVIDGDKVVREITNYLPRFCSKGMGMRRRVGERVGDFDFNVHNRRDSHHQHGRGHRHGHGHDANTDDAPPSMHDMGEFGVITQHKFKLFILLTTFTPLFAALYTVLSTSSSYSYTLYEPFTLYSNFPTKEESVYIDRPGSVPSDHEVTLSSSLITFLAVAMDAASVYSLARHVFCLYPRWTPTLAIDTNPKTNHLKVSEQVILLTDIKSIHRFSKTYCWVITALYILGGMPVNCSLMIVKSLWLPYADARVYTGVLGVLSILRSFSTSNMFVKAIFALEYMLSPSTSMRDEMGVSLKRVSTYYMSFFCFCVTSIPTGYAVAMYHYHSQLHSFFASVLVGLLAAFYALVLGQLQGLPTYPEFKITCWPAEGYFVKYKNKAHCPCLYYGAYCSGMHSRVGVMVVFVDDVMRFHQMLKGEPTFPDEE